MLAVLTVLVLIIAGAAAALIYPGTPRPARSLKFQGYIVLPKSGGLTILDYLTIHGRDLFVTNVSRTLFMQMGKFSQDTSSGDTE